MTNDLTCPGWYSYITLDSHICIDLIMWLDLRLYTCMHAIPPLSDKLCDSYIHCVLSNLAVLILVSYFNGHQQFQRQERQSVITGHISVIAIQRNTKKCEFHTVMYYNSRIHACTEERKDISAHSVCMCKYWSVHVVAKYKNRTILNILSTLYHC